MILVNVFLHTSITISFSTDILVLICFQCMWLTDIFFSVINATMIKLTLCQVCSDSEVHGANMEPTWVLSAPDGPHVWPRESCYQGGHICVMSHGELYNIPSCQCPNVILTLLERGPCCLRTSWCYISALVIVLMQWAVGWSKWAGLLGMCLADGAM